MYTLLAQRLEQLEQAQFVRPLLRAEEDGGKGWQRYLTSGRNKRQGAKGLCDRKKPAFKSTCWASTVVDARAELLTPERFPAADDLRLGIPDEVFDFAACGAATAVVVTAHNYAYEVPVLREVLCSEAGYIGLVAGRRRGQAVMAFLEQTGVDPEQLRRVRARAGLDIGALTPEEIALSIFAEIIAHREGKLGLPLTQPEAARSETRSAFASA